MKVNGKHYQTIWLNEPEEESVSIIDQRFLPFQFIIEKISSVEQMAQAIKEMHLRGAGLIGVAAAYGMYLASLEAPTTSLKEFQEFLKNSARKLKQTRPTAVNLAWAVQQQLDSIQNLKKIPEIILKTKETAKKIAGDDAKNCRKIGSHGLKLIEKISQKKGGETVNILTHCNAGWLAFVDYGSALSPIYAAFDKGLKIHVWVDETRPRNQGARLTAWELSQHGIPHTLIADNTGGHLMQHGQVDMVIVGSDRTTANGDVANKIGTYLKALAAHDNKIPFYVAFPSSTIDWNMLNGLKNIPIETRDAKEVKYMEGTFQNEVVEFLICPESTPAINYGFDVTPARLITKLITEKGICAASEQGLKKLFGAKSH